MRGAIIGGGPSFPHPVVSGLAGTGLVGGGTPIPSAWLDKLTMSGRTGCPSLGEAAWNRPIPPLDSGLRRNDGGGGGVRMASSRPSVAQRQATGSFDCQQLRRPKSLSLVLANPPNPLFKWGAVLSPFAKGGFALPPTGSPFYPSTRIERPCPVPLETFKPGGIMLYCGVARI